VGLTHILITASVMSTTLNILYVALGLGLVIFFHELGHFAVAKWCNVRVERFSIGFGPVVWSFKKGETEYALSLIPVGGYVKMLGQDDMDPSQLTSEEIAEDPRSYSAKSVPQRMAIISAGVIMNVITGMLFYALAFGWGVRANPPKIGTVRVGMPAWKAGLQTGDEVLTVNDREMESYRDVQMGVALSSDDVKIQVRRDGKVLEPMSITPDGRGTRRIIGIMPAIGKRLIDPPPDSKISVTVPGTPAAAAEPSFQPSDDIRRIDDVDVPDFATLRRVLAEKRDKDLTFYVHRKDDPADKLVKIPVARHPFRTLGLSMEIGEIAAVRSGSPAARAGLRAGDKITEVSFADEDLRGLPLGTKLNPLRLPDLFETAARNRETVTLKVLRKDSDQEPKPITVEFKDSDPVLHAWTEKPSAEGVPLSIPSLGVAFHMIPMVRRVEKDSPAENAGIKEQWQLTSMTLTLPEDAEPDGVKDRELEITFGEKDKDGRAVHNWAYAFWAMQSYPTRSVRLTFSDKDGDSHTTDITPQRSEDWFLPVRGIRPEMEFIVLEASGPIDALRLGFKRARDSMIDIYMTIASLFGGRLSYKELSGPVRIAKVAYSVTEQGVPYLLLFLGFISINLAVLNFLPIPVLDGGHMVFLIWEAVTRKKPSEKVMIGATYVGLAFVLGLMGLVLYLDLFVHK